MMAINVQRAPTRRPDGERLGVFQRLGDLLGFMLQRRQQGRQALESPYAELAPCLPQRALVLRP